MAEAETPIPATIDAYERARGETLDGHWAFGVFWKLSMKGVDVTLVDEGLRESLELVRETGESPEELFGPPADHANELYRRWRSEGRLNPSAVGVPAARSVVASSLKAGGWIALVMFVLELIGRRDLPVGFLGLPFVLGFATIGGLAFWEWASREWATPVAVTAVATTVLGTAAVSVAALDVTSSISLGRLTAWLLLAEGTVLWFAGSATLVLVTAKTYAAVREDPDDEQWVRRFSGVLRGPGWQSDARVLEIVKEARSHAAESGRTLAEEFGSPDTHAATYGVNTLRRTTLKVAFLGVLACLTLVLALDGLSWATAALALIFAWQAWWEYRKYDKHRTRAQSGR